MTRYWRRFATGSERAIAMAVWLVAAMSLGTVVCAAQDAPPAAVGAVKPSSPLGTVKSISGNSLTLASDAGADVNVEVRDSTKIVRIAPGQTDLKDAQTIALMDLQVGDRILVRGKATDDNKSFAAATIVVMKKADIAEKQAHERDEWQKSGVGGLVNSVDAASGVISITTPSVREKKTVTVHVSQQTVLRRYAPGSVKFDDAKPAPIAEIHPGDQLRARGEKAADGSELTAAEVVSGNFRNISGTISSMDAAQGTITVRDLATKKSVTIKIGPDSQLRKLPPQVAQRIAQRLNGSGAPGGAANGEQGSTAEGATAPTAKDPAPGTDKANAGGASGQGRQRQFGGRQRDGQGPGGSGGPGGAADLQQMLSRMPASTIADLHKEDAVMLVGTDSGSGTLNAITLLAGVEPILQSSPNSASSILSPWSLSGAPSEGGGTP